MKLAAKLAATKPMVPKPATAGALPMQRWARWQLVVRAAETGAAVEVAALPLPVALAALATRVANATPLRLLLVPPAGQRLAVAAAVAVVARP